MNVQTASPAIASAKSVAVSSQTRLVTPRRLSAIAGRSSLKVQWLVKTFGAIRAVDAVSFEMRPGEIYGLLGPNDAGKTTTSSMISGLLKPDAGGVFVAGAAFWFDPQKAKLRESFNLCRAGLPVSPKIRAAQQRRPAS